MFKENKNSFFILKKENSHIIIENFNLNKKIDLTDFERFADLEEPADLDELSGFCLRGGCHFSELTASQEKADTVINLGGNQCLVLENFELTRLSSDNFIVNSPHMYGPYAEDILFGNDERPWEMRCNRLPERMFYESAHELNFTTIENLLKEGADANDGFNNACNNKNINMVSWADSLESAQFWRNSLLRLGCREDLPLEARSVCSHYRHV